MQAHLAWSLQGVDIGRLLVAKVLCDGSILNDEIILTYSCLLRSASSLNITPHTDPTRTSRFLPQCPLAILPIIVLILPLLSSTSGLIHSSATTPSTILPPFFK